MGFFGGLLVFGGPSPALGTGHGVLETVRLAVDCSMVSVFFVFEYWCSSSALDLLLDARCHRAVTSFAVNRKSGSKQQVLACLPSPVLPARPGGRHLAPETC